MEESFAFQNQKQPRPVSLPRSDFKNKEHNTWIYNLLSYSVQMLTWLREWFAQARGCNRNTMGRPVLKFGMYHVVCRITPHFENRPLIEFPLLRLWITTQTSFGFLIDTPKSGFPEKRFPPAKVSVWLAPDSTCGNILYTGSPFWG